MMVSAKKKKKKRTEQNRTFSGVRTASTVSIELRMNMPKKLLYDETETTSYITHVILFFLSYMHRTPRSLPCAYKIC